MPSGSSASRNSTPTATTGEGELAVEEPLQMDAVLRVRQQQPGRGVQQQGGRAEQGENDDDAAHDDDIDAEARCDAGADTTDPAGLTHDAEAAHPVEEGIGRRTKALPPVVSQIACFDLRRGPSTVAMGCYPDRTLTYRPDWKSRRTESVLIGG